MQQEVIQLNQKFKGQFELPTDSFLNPVDFIDAFGFSTLKKHKNNYVSVFSVILSKEHLASDNPLKPIQINVSYGKETDRGILTASSSEKIKGMFDPIDLVSSDDFFYNIETGDFFHKDSKVKAKYILEYIDKLHIKSTKPFRGLWLRVKLIFWRVVVLWLIKILSGLFVRILNLITGAKVSKNIWNRVVSQDRIEKEINSPEIIEGKTIDFFGYKASARAIIFYCYLHLSLYIFFSIYNFRPNVLMVLFKNNFLTIIYIISSLSLVEIVLPNILKFFIKKTSILFLKVVDKKIKV